MNLIIIYKSQLSNHCFVSCKHMMTKTTTANEYRHKNYKHSEDRVQPNFNVAQSAYKMNEKRNHGVNKKMKREATLTSASSACTTNIRDDINPKALQWFCNTWKNKKYYVHMIVSYDTLCVMRLHYDLDAENNITLIFKRVRNANLVNSCYVCSWKLHTHIGTCCACIAAIIDEVTTHFWHAIHAKSHNFHFLRESTSVQLNKSYEHLVFTNSSPGVYWDKMPSCNNHPHLSPNEVNPSSFTDVSQ